jgi:hypothetical protein
MPIAFALALAPAPAHAVGITGQYIEARTCDIYTAPCFANSEMNLTGKHAIMAWKVDRGSFDGVRLDGLGVAAVIATTDTLGLEQTGHAKALLLVDAKANARQRAALIRLARRQAGNLVRRVVAIESAPIRLQNCHCQGGGCARLQVGKVARISTRCIDCKLDKACGNDVAYYPPLAKDVQAQAAMALEHSFTGKGFNETWSDTQRREAYVGSFVIR